MLPAAAAEGLADLIEKVRAMVASYASSYSAIQRECGRHKLDLTDNRPGDMAGSAVARFNNTAGINQNAAGAAIGGLLKLQEMIAELPDQSREAIGSFRPNIEREDA